MIYPLLLIANYALLALTFVLGKEAVALAHPLVIIGLRMSAAGLLLLVFVYARAPSKFRIQKKDLATFFKVSLFHIYLAFVAEFWALQHLPSNHVNIIYSFTPLFTAALAYFIKNEPLNRKKKLALGIGLIGIAPGFFEQNSAETFDASTHFLAEISLVIAVISSTYAWFDIEKLMNKYSILLINGVAMSIGGIGSLLTAACVLNSDQWIIERPADLALLIGGLILLSNFIFYNLFGALLRHYSLTFLSFAGLLSPIFGAFWGRVLLFEKINATYWGSVFVLLVALLIFYSQERNEEKTIKSA